MSPASRQARTAVLSERECARLLKTMDLGRIAIVVDGVPQIFPVNYAYEERVVVFRTSPGLKLERGPETPAAFEVDSVDRRTGVAWSVVVHGTAQEISGAADTLAQRLRRLVVRPQAPGTRTRWMAVYAGRITGRRFRLR
jgi:nitroimidazol reductase NimA-like FMN-containing flavoprotein (pyridoxamine 5'-phosphate oxidase superfamily)